MPPRSLTAAYSQGRCKALQVERSGRYFDDRARVHHRDGQTTRRPDNTVSARVPDVWRGHWSKRRHARLNVVQPVRRHRNVRGAASRHGQRPRQLRRIVRGSAGVGMPRIRLLNRSYGDLFGRPILIRLSEKGEIRKVWQVLVRRFGGEDCAQYTSAEFGVIHLRPLASFGPGKCCQSIPHEHRGGPAQRERPGPWAPNSSSSSPRCHGTGWTTAGVPQHNARPCPRCTSAISIWPMPRRPRELLHIEPSKTQRHRKVRQSVRRSTRVRSAIERSRRSSRVRDGSSREVNPRAARRPGLTGWSAVDRRWISGRDKQKGHNPWAPERWLARCLRQIRAVCRIP